MNGALDLRDLELNALLEVTQAINNNLPEDDLYRIYRFTVLADLQVKKMLLYVKDAEWTCKVQFGNEKHVEAPELPQAFHDLHEPQSAIETPPFEAFDLVFPVMHKKRLLAVVFVGGLDENGSVDTTFLRALTNILIVAIENKKLARQQLQQEAYRRELEIAKKVQNFLFPKSLPQSPELKVEAVYLPHHDVGGDYYDYIKLDENKFLLCIADVSGKGVPAALLMSNFQASLRTLVRKTQDLEEIIKELNHSTYSSSNGENFITVFLGIYDRSEKEFTYANCGHNQVFLKPVDDELKILEEGTTILGMFDPLPFLTTSKLEGLADFVFFGYTDGLIEALNPEDEQFGYERLLDLVSQPFQSLSALHTRLFKALDDFRQNKPYDDDITIISCQVSA